MVPRILAGLTSGNQFSFNQWQRVLYPNYIITEDMWKKKPPDITIIDEAARNQNNLKLKSAPQKIKRD